MRQTKIAILKISGINYSHTITLPKEWITKTGLKRGDFVNCEINEDGSLLIRKSNVDEKIV